jgi:hypothetical protein
VTDNSHTYEEIEGVVTRKDTLSLFFREQGASHDICIPLSQIENADAVSKGDDSLSVSKWFLKKIEEAGRR